jgi:low affinity Fe/Cu permease
METIDVVFRKISDWASYIVGTPAAFVLAFSSVVIWGLLGPIFHYTTTWQLTINTGTTIITYLLVFLIQSSQNKDTRAIQLKLDRLIDNLSEVHGEDVIGVEQDPKKMKEEIKSARS